MALISCTASAGVAQNALELLKPGVPLQAALAVLGVDGKTFVNCKYTRGSEHAQCSIYARFTLAGFQTPVVKTELIVHKQKREVESVALTWYAFEGVDLDAAYRQVHERALATWGNPLETDSECPLWGTDGATVVLCRKEKEFLYGATASDLPLLPTSGDLQWWPQWTPFRIRGIRAGMDSDLVVSAFGEGEKQGCTPAPSYSPAHTECSWRSPLISAGHPAWALFVTTDTLTNRARAFRFSFGPYQSFDQAESARSAITADLLAEMPATYAVQEHELSTTYVSLPFTAQTRTNCSPTGACSRYYVGVSLSVMEGGEEEDQADVIRTR